MQAGISRRKKERGQPPEAATINDSVALIDLCCRRRAMSSPKQKEKRDDGVDMHLLIPVFFCSLAVLFMGFRSEVKGGEGEAG